MTFQKPPLTATLLMLAGIALLLGLGTWQVQRLQWKRQWLAQIEKAYAVDPDDHVMDAGVLKAEYARGTLFLRGALHGAFRHGKALALGIRTRNGAPGYHIITPYVLENGGTVLVNRGWVPQTRKDEILQQDNQRRPAMISGYVRPPDPSFMAPDNRPAQDIWYKLDIEQIAIVKQLRDVMPYLLYMEAPDLKDGVVLHDKKWRPHNNHLQYAVFWYLMALTLLVIYLLRFVIHFPARRRA